VSNGKSFIFSKCFDILLKSRSLSSDESSLKVSSLNEHDRILCLEEIMWRQRVCFLWLKQGDQNSKFFHRVANIRYRYNLIYTLHFQEETLTNNVDITHAFTTYFFQIFGVPHHPLLHANWGILYPNYVWSLKDIEQAFEEELRVAIFRLGAEKSRGPGGFPIIFFQKFWNLVKADILSLFGQLYNGVMDLRCLNNALDTLIPKKECAFMTNEFHLISLLNVVIKIITKILAIDFILTFTSS